MTTQSVQIFMNSPLTYFGESITPMHFSHTAYKAYPAALIDNNRWDLMTRWLDKLTSYDLSQVDVEGWVIYVLSGSDEAGLRKANRLGRLIYEALVALPEFISTTPKVVDDTLLENVAGSRLTEDWYRVFGGEHAEGAIVVSQLDEPVYYSTLLSGRVANIVPVDGIDKVTDAVNAYTQTIGIYPESLKVQLRDTLSLFGAQRLTSLGYAASVNFAIPQDAMEPVRRMCKWVVEEECSPDQVLPLWESRDLTPIRTTMWRWPSR
jgi:hypothetical protein